MRDAIHNPKRWRRFPAGLLLAAAFLSPLSAWAATYWVDDTTDPGVASASDCSTTCDPNSVNCSLMDALAKATSTDEIRFCASGTYNLTTPGTYNLAGKINIITYDSITISGGAAYGQEHGVVLKGNMQQPCISIYSNNNAIQGLTIQNCAWAIFISGDDNKVQNNYLGTDSTGKLSGSAIWNTAGVRIEQGDSNIVGTDGDGNNDASEGNLIIPDTRGGAGIVIPRGVGNRVAGNVIGLTSEGKASGSTGAMGVNLDVNSSFTTVGTNGDGVSDDLERNVISGFSGNSGVFIASCNSNAVAGNYIGTGLDGTSGIGNRTGVWLGCNGPSNNRVGTNGDGVSDDLERNIIAANVLEGVVIAASGSVIAGNYIGTGVDGTVDLGNGRNGISIVAGSSNVIGGDIAAESNLIRFNGDLAGEYGIMINSFGFNNSIQRNLIYDNQDGEIEVVRNGTAVPAIASIAGGAGDGQILITISSTAGNKVQAWSDGDGDGRCEAVEYIGLATDNGDGTFSVTATGLAKGDKITATAKDATNTTSELTPCSPVPDLPPVFDEIPDQFVYEGQTLDLDLTSYDHEYNADDAPPTYACRNDDAAAKGKDVCSHLSTVDGAFSWPTDYTDAGIYTVTFFSIDDSLTAPSDGDYWFDTEVVMITVIDVDRPPDLLPVEDKAVFVGDMLLFNLSATDPDGDAISYSCSANCPNGISVSATNGTVSWIPTADQVGIHSGVTFTALARALSDQEQTTITVRARAVVPVCPNSKIEGTEQCEIGHPCSDPNQVCDESSCICKPRKCDYDGEIDTALGEECDTAGMSNEDAKAQEADACPEDSAQGVPFCIMNSCKCGFLQPACMAKPGAQCWDSTMCQAGQICDSSCRCITPNTAPMTTSCAADPDAECKGNSDCEMGQICDSGCRCATLNIGPVAASCADDPEAECEGDGDCQSGQICDSQCHCRAPAPPPDGSAQRASWLPTESDCSVEILSFSSNAARERIDELNKAYIAEPTGRDDYHAFVECEQRIRVICQINNASLPDTDAFLSLVDVAGEPLPNSADGIRPYALVQTSGLVFLNFKDATKIQYKMVIPVDTPIRISPLAALPTDSQGKAIASIVLPSSMGTAISEALPMTDFVPEMPILFSEDTALINDMIRHEVLALGANQSITVDTQGMIQREQSAPIAGQAVPGKVFHVITMTLPMDPAMWTGVGGYKGAKNVEDEDADIEKVKAALAGRVTAGQKPNAKVFSGLPWESYRNFQFTLVQDLYGKAAEGNVPQEGLSQEFGVLTVNALVMGGGSGGCKGCYVSEGAVDFGAVAPWLAPILISLGGIAAGRIRRRAKR